MSGIERPATPDGVVVGEADLRRITDAVAAELLRRLGDLSGAQQHGPGDAPAIPALAGGVTTGGTVTVASTLYACVIGATSGYAPNGAAIDFGGPSGALPVADPTVGGLNYYGLVYTETQDQPGAHETTGVAEPRRIQRAARAVVYSAAAYAALPATAADLSQDAQDRFLVLRIVLGNGVLGSGVPVGLLKAGGGAAALGDVPAGSGPPGAGRVITASQPSVVTGCELVSMDAGTPLGAGGLTYAAAPFNPAPTLAWQAPGDALGAAQNVGVADGALITLTSGAPSNKKLVVRVYPGLMPLGGAPPGLFSDVITVGVMPTYEPSARRLTAVDDAHRHALGSMLPSAANPHGTSALDFVLTLLGVPQTLRVGTGLVTTLSQALTPRLFVPSATGTTVREYLGGFPLPWPGPGAAPWVRLYIDNNSTGALEITVNALWSDSGTGASQRWSKDAATAPAQRLVLNGTVFSIDWYTNTTPGPWVDGGWSVLGTAALAFATDANGSRATHGLSGTLVSGQDILATSAQALIARFLTSYAPGGGTVTLVNEYLGPAGFLIREYFTTANERWTTWNASVDIGGNWHRDVAGPSTRITESPSWAPRVETHASGAPGDGTDGWGSGLWVATANVVPATGVVSAVTFQGGLGLDATAAATATATPRLASTQQMTAATKRYLLEQHVDTITGVGWRRYAFINAGGDFYEEETVNARWDLATGWHSDAASPATCLRKGTSGVISLSRATPPATWTDTIGAGGWDAGGSSWAISRAVPAFPPPGGGGANTYSALSFIKAWGYCQLIGGAVSLLDGVGLANPSPVQIVPGGTGGSGLQWNLDPPMNSANYLVLSIDNTPRTTYTELGLSAGTAALTYDAPSGGTDQGSTHQMAKVWAEQQNANNFKMFAARPGQGSTRAASGGAYQVNNGADNYAALVDLNDVRVAGMILGFVLLGRQ